MTRISIRDIQDNNYEREIATLPLPEPSLANLSKIDVLLGIFCSFKFFNNHNYSLPGDNCQNMLEKEYYTGEVIKKVNKLDQFVFIHLFSIHHAIS